MLGHRIDVPDLDAKPRKFALARKAALARTTCIYGLFETRTELSMTQRDGKTNGETAHK